MTDTLLIFTFSPVQPFIAEARRAADLYCGSRILVKLAQSVAETIGKERLIYPAEITDDVPNKIVARVPMDACRTLAEAAWEKLLFTWREEIAQQAGEEFLQRFNPPINSAPASSWFKGEQKTLLGCFDSEWDDIWKRQTSKDYLWEVYWSAVELKNEADYPNTYLQAEKALAAVKRVRPFIAAEEPGIKDSLSGRRQALHIQKKDAKVYWNSILEYGRVTPAKLRAGERLDAIGVIKRFSSLAERGVGSFKGFPSTSSVASMDFLTKARQTSEGLKTYKGKITTLLRGDKFIIRSDSNWPFDGDLLYYETLREKTFRDEFGIDPVDQHALTEAQTALRDLYKAVGDRPSAYYAIIVIDGDDMGERVGKCVTEAEHRELSRKLTGFAQKVHGIAQKHSAFVVYNGGDDVLAMAPLSTAFEFARELADEFKKTDGTASAGIAIAHHQSPLSAALRTARQSEAKAKRIDSDPPLAPGPVKKAAVCVTALKRSGETLEMRSKWDAVDGLLAEVVNLFSEDTSPKKLGAAVASKLAYDVQRAVYSFAVIDEKFQSELKRLLKRHINEKHPNAPDAHTLSTRLCAWGATLPDGPEELAHWLLFARFVAQGGGGE